MEKNYISSSEKDIVFHHMMECVGWDTRTMSWKVPDPNLPWLCIEWYGFGKNKYYTVAYSELQNTSGSNFSIIQDECMKLTL